MAFLKAKGVNLDEGGSKYLDSSSLSVTNGSTQEDNGGESSNPYETGEVDVYATEYQPGQSYQTSGTGYSQI
jgi:hypothetical protein